MGREGSAPKSFVVAEAEAISLAEGSIRATVKARLPGAVGVPSPGHVSMGILQELGKTTQSPPAQTGVVHLTATGRALAGTDAPAQGAKKHPAEEVAGGRGTTGDCRGRVGRSLMIP